MPRGTRRLTPVVLAACGAFALAAAAPASADPVLPVVGQTPSATISELESQGYDVQINYTRGNSSTPLDLCTVTGINNPNRAGSKTFTTVYVDISCPDPFADD